jgi:hypothetical protein
MTRKPATVRIVHGDAEAKLALQAAFLPLGVNAIIAR